MIEPSFIIDESKLKKLSTIGFINKYNLIKDFPLLHKLKDLDLSEVDFFYVSSNIDLNFDGWEIENVIFSQFDPKKREKNHLYGLSFIGAKMKRVSFAQAFLDRCNFDANEDDKQQNKEDSSNCFIDGKKQKSINLENIDFFFSEFSYCRFRSCTMKRVDFRYAKVSDCSMNETEVTYGDFYCCDFKGCTAFVESKFKECSFTNAVFEHQIIRYKSISGILQDDIEKYRKIVFAGDWQRYNSCGIKRKHEPTDEEIIKEAKEMYKQLSGIYAGKGLIRDSNAAYSKMKRKELRLSWEKASKSVLGLLLFLTLIGFIIYMFIIYAVVRPIIGVCILIFLYDCIKDKIEKALHFIGDKIDYLHKVPSGLFTHYMGYGYKNINVFIAYIVLILIGAAGYSSYKVYDKFSWEHALKAINVSFYNIVDFNQSSVQHDYWGVFTSIHHLLGVLLIGYLGFIFANKMRNDL